MILYQFIYDSTE